MGDEDIDKAADVFLALWQENIRLWAVEKELLAPRELGALLEAAGLSTPVGDGSSFSDKEGDENAA